MQEKNIRLKPPGNVDNSRNVSERVSRFFDSLFELDVLLQLFGILVGLAFLGYVLTAWVIHLIRDDRLFVGLIAAFAGVLLTGLALARIPVAMYVLFGSAAIGAVALFGGYSAILLP